MKRWQESSYHNLFYMHALLQTISALTASRRSPEAVAAPFKGWGHGKTPALLFTEGPH